MSGTFLSGPSVVAGPMLGNQAGQTPQEYSAEFGPSIGYQGDAIPDVRFSPINKDNPLPASIPAHFNSPYFLQVDAIPAAQSNTNIAALQNPSASTAMTLQGASFGVSPNIPMVQVSTNAIVTPALMLDFGMAPIVVTAGSTTATPGTVQNSASVNFNSINFLTLGQWIVIDKGVSATQPLIAQVVGINLTAGTITLSTPATNSSGATGFMFGSGNLLSNLAYGTAAAHVPALPAGLARIWDPQQCIARTVSVSSGALAVSGVFTVKGYDLYGNLQTENISVSGANATAYGKKAFKGIISVTPTSAFTDGAHQYSVGTSDVFGFAVRSDRWEATSLFWAGSFMTAASYTGGAWLPADITSPATATTGDVRGTVQTSANGSNGSVTASASNGSLSANAVSGRRLAIYSSINLYNLIAATPTNTAPMYGVPPA